MFTICQTASRHPEGLAKAMLRFYRRQAAISLGHSWCVPNRRCSSALSASFLRGGTSKGVFLSSTDLPGDRAQLDSILLGIMGSPDPAHGRQLNGMGGGVSSLSKAVIVGPAIAKNTQDAADVDVQYTFAQIGIRDSVVDFSGNCGNLTSMVGPFAIWAGLCTGPRLTSHPDGTLCATVRAFNVNTSKRIDISFPVERVGASVAPVLDLPDVEIAGVAGKASRITLDFLEPGGARTGQLLPSGSPSNLVSLPGGDSIEVSLVDATNPTVFVDSLSLFSFTDLHEAPSRNIHTHSESFSSRTLALLEHIRRESAILMGLDPSAQAQPKISVLSEPPMPANVSANAHIIAHTLSMGVLHRAIPMTVGLCLGVAANVPGTIPWRIVGASHRRMGTSSDATIRIRHPSGVVDVGADVKTTSAGVLEAKSAKVIRTGKRLMNGLVWT